MKMMLTFFITIWSCLISFGQTITDNNRAIIWRGFHHQWMYNHRINCIGDFVKRFDYDHGGNPTVTHTSATGTGPDHTKYDSYYTLIESSSAVFAEMKEHIAVKGTFDSLSPDNRKFPIHFNSPHGPKLAYMGGKTNYITLLNGFELNSIAAADKIRSLKIEIIDSSYDKTSQALNLIINTDMSLDCNSAECKKGIKTFDYEFDIYVLIIGYNSDDVVTSQNKIDIVDKWDRQTELKDSAILPTFKLDNSSHFPFVTVGIKSFSIQLDTGLHLLQWNSFLQQPVTMGDAKNTYIQVPADFQFKQWRKNMKCAHPLASDFSYREAGAATISVGLVAMQFKEMELLSYQESHQNPVMFWPGWGRKSYNKVTGKFDSKAIQIYDIATHMMEPQK